MPPRNDNRYDPRSPRDRRLRAGDREREAVGEILRQQHAEGRLDNEEFQQRIERCLAAKTYAELDELLTDLPGPETERPARPTSARRRRPLPFALLPLAVIAAIALSGGHLIWLAVPLFFLFVVRPRAWRSAGPGHLAGARPCGARYRTRTDPHV
jgi:DUF1707 SHOCT-like domain